MKRAILDSVTLEYEVVGEGEPVVFIHGAFIADSSKPLVGEPSLASQHRLITYHRRGYMGSSRTPGPVSIGQQAADCRALLLRLGVERVHVVGDSFGGCVALQLALSFPKLVHSLALLEPALMVGASAQEYRESLMRAAQRYREVGAAAVTNEFFKARWPEYRSALEQMQPGALAQAIASANATFELDIGILDWVFGEAEARRIEQPALVVMGSNSVRLSPRFEETFRFLLDLLPSPEAFILPGATHFLQLESPDAARTMAGALAAFFAHHPITG